MSIGWYFLQMSWVKQHQNRLPPFQDLSVMMETVELREFIFYKYISFKDYECGRLDLLADILTVIFIAMYHGQWHP